MVQIMRQFEPFDYKAVVITKLDETNRIGNAISALAETGQADLLRDQRAVGAAEHRARARNALLDEPRGLPRRPARASRRATAEGSRRNRGRGSGASESRGPGRAGGRAEGPRARPDGRERPERLELSMEDQAQALREIMGKKSPADEARRRTPTRERLDRTRQEDAGSSPSPRARAAWGRPTSRSTSPSPTRR